MIYLGIDPSYTRTGVVLLDDVAKTIKFVAVSPPGSNSDYKTMINRSAFIAINIIRHLNLKKDVTLVMEEPLVTSPKASSLGVLSASIAWALTYLPNVKEMYTIHPSYVSSLNRPVVKRTGLSKKQTSKYVAEKVVEHFIERKGYSMVIHNDLINKNGDMKKRSVSHDEAEAFILLSAVLIKDKVMDDLDMVFLGSINRKFYKESPLRQFK